MTNTRQTFLAAALAVALPLGVLAQGPGAGPSGPPPATGPGAQGQAQGQGRGPKASPERMQKRMKLARTLGLAEALDLEPAQALKLGETLSRFDERRVAIHKQLRDSRDVLRRAAHGEKVSGAEVDQAIQKGLEARTQLQAIDRETLSSVTQGLTPEKKARAVLFLSNFSRHFRGGPGMQGDGMGPGGGPGMGHGRGMGPGRGGMGPGRGRGAGPGGPGGWGMGPGGDDVGPGELMGMGPPPFEDEED